MAQRRWVHPGQLAFDFELPPRPLAPPRQRLPRNKLIAMNEINYRIGEDHGRATLTNHDVELIVGLLVARSDAIETSEAAGMDWAAIARHLAVLHLSYRRIAEKMECSIRHVRDIDAGRVRSQVAARWKRVNDAGKAGA